VSSAVAGNDPRSALENAADFACHRLDRLPQSIPPLQATSRRLKHADGSRTYCSVVLVSRCHCPHHAHSRSLADPPLVDDN